VSSIIDLTNEIRAVTSIPGGKPSNTAPLNLLHYMANLQLLAVPLPPPPYLLLLLALCLRRPLLQARQNVEAQNVVAQK
jgi:hypothetical protein